MGLPIFHSQYTAAQIEASIGKTPRIKASTRTWEIWDIATSAYVDTGVSIDTELFVDNTLTEAGYAADAKVTGDKVSEIKSAFSSVCGEGLLITPDSTEWVLRKTISNTGVVSNSDYYAITDFIPIAGETVEYTGAKQDTSGNNFVCFLCQYKANQVFLNRTALRENGETQNIKIADNCESIRFVFGRATASGRVFVATDIQYFSARFTTTIAGNAIDIRAIKAVLDHINDIMFGKKITLTSSNDLDDITESGIYDVVSVSRPTNFPVNANGIVCVFSNGNSIVQMVIAGDFLFYRRKYGTGTFTGWIKIQGDVVKGIRQLTTEDDLDTITENGIYSILQSTQPTNSPITSAGLVLIFTQGTTSYSTQRAQIVFSSKNVLTRFNYGSGFTDWITIGNTIIQKRILDSLDDLDEVLDMGIYRIVTGSIPENAPSTTGGMCVVDVFENTLNPFIRQTYITSSDQYFRIRASNRTWNRWISLTAGGAASALTWGKSNVIASAKQLYNIQYTPTEVMPNQSADFAKDTPVTGLPYSSARMYHKMIGYDVSLHTFMTAVRNPRSVLYTRRLTTQNAKTYYGTVCSVLTNYALDMDYYWTTDDMRGDKGGKGLTQHPFSAMQIGDFVINDTHTMLIIGLTYDEYGRIVTVSYAESTPPKCRASSNVNYNSFVAARISEGYNLYRYGGVDDTQYKASDYVKGYADETLPEIIYPDIMPEYGDKAVILSGEDVTINVLNGSGYSQIIIEKDGETFQTKSTIEDFMMDDIQPGTYTFILSDGTNTSESQLLVVDHVCSYNSETHVLQYDSDNATPFAVISYTPVTKTANHTHILTQAEIVAGEYDMSEMVNESFSEVKVMFKTAWGTATWLSNDLHQWEAVT